MNIHRYLGASCASAIACMALASAASAQSEPAPQNSPSAPAVAPQADPAGSPSPDAPESQAVPAPTGADGTSSPGDDIIVTGSSIRGAPPVGSNLMSVGQAQIQSTPAQSVQQILTSVPAVNGLGMAGQGGYQSNDSSGANIPSIHGLGGSSSTSTLALIDGHRFPLTGTIHALGDPNMVPPAAIERVEVLADGASSVYGSDAVAGVINFITRKQFNGVEASAQTGFADQYRTTSASLLAGTVWDTGSVYLAYNYSYRGNLLAADRGYTARDHRAQGGSNLASFACQPASVQPAGSSLVYAYPYDGAGVVNTQANAFCDYSGYADLLPQEVRNSGMIKAIQQVGDKLTLSVDVLYSNRRDHTIDARGSTTTTIFGPGSGRGDQINPFYQFIPGNAATSQTIRMNFDDLLGPGAYTDAGAEDFYVHANADYKINDNWRLTADGVIGVDTSFARDVGLICSSCANLALNGSTNGSGSLTAPSVPSTGLIVTQPLTVNNALDPYNLFGNTRTSAAVLAGLKDNLAQLNARQTIKDLKLQLQGTLFDLPAGPVKVSIGGEGVIYTLYSERIASLNIGPSSTGSAASQFPFPARKVVSGFVEALVPVIDEDMHVPGVRSFTLNLSGRYDHYNDFGSTTNPRIGANWEVFDGLKLRGNWAKSFVAPQVVFQGINGKGLNAESGYGLATTVVNVPVNAFPVVAQLPGCAETPTCTIGTGSITGLQLNGGQPLKAQKGTTYSLGADFTPRFAPGLRIGVTYWHNKFNGGATAPSASLAVGSPSLFSRFQFFPNGATPEQIAAAVGGVAQTTAIPSTVYYIYDFRIGNVLNLTVSGLDIDMNYSFDTSFGRFRIGNAFTELLQFKQQAGNGPKFSILNTDGFNSTFPSIQLQGRANIGWELGNLSFDGYVNYTGGYRNYSGTTVAPIVRDDTNSPIGGGDRVRPNVTIDMHIAYTLPHILEKTQVFIDANNLFDRDPPFFNSNNGYDPLAGNPIGRLITIGVRTKF